MRQNSNILGVSFYSQIKEQKFQSLVVIIATFKLYKRKILLAGVGGGAMRGCGVEDLGGLGRRAETSRPKM